MYIKSILAIVAIILFNVSIAQNSEKYLELIDEAWELYEDKEYLKSANKYSEAFVVEGAGTLDDMYNAACSWALANKPDSSFAKLFVITESGYFTDLEHLTCDSDLNSLHADERWNEVIVIVKSNRKNFDITLMAVLDTIYQKDQGYRHQIDETEEAHGYESEEMNAQLKKMKEQDSLNLIKVEKILNERGWLGPDIIGYWGNLTLWLVIQHSAPDIVETYLPMMREAVLKGDARADHLGYLEDRNNKDQNRKQIYGSQFGNDVETGEGYVWPLEDPDNVDKRRAEIGLGTMQEYLSELGSTWDLEAHKKRIIEFERKTKN